MRHIERHQIDLATLYMQCTNQKRDGSARLRLGLARDTVLQAAGHYDELAQAMQIYHFVQPDIPDGGATKEDLVGLYDNGLARKQGAG